MRERQRLIIWTSLGFLLSFVIESSENERNKKKKKTSPTTIGLVNHVSRVFKETKDTKRSSSKARPRQSLMAPKTKIP